MTRKRIVFNELDFDSKVKDLKVEYPLCLISKNKKEFYRYGNDGRFEHLVIRENDRYCLSFGIYANELHDVYNHDDFWFKILSQRFDKITDEEFSEMVGKFIQGYDRYLKGEDFIAREIKEEIDNRVFDKRLNVISDGKQKEEDYPF